jgi:toxin ParE1/3/4
LVIWSEPAKKSLKSIFYFISEDSNYYAKEVVDTIVGKSDYLQEFPDIGRIVPELNTKNIRELIVYSYRLIYEIVGTDIHILALIHGKQKFPDEI